MQNVTTADSPLFNTTATGTLSLQLCPGDGSVNWHVEGGSGRLRRRADRLGFFASASSFLKSDENPARTGRVRSALNYSSLFCCASGGTLHAIVRAVMQGI